MSALALLPLPTPPDVLGPAFEIPSRATARANGRCEAPHDKSEPLPSLPADERNAGPAAVAAPQCPPLPLPLPEPLPARDSPAIAELPAAGGTRARSTPDAPDFTDADLARALAPLFSPPTAPQAAPPPGDLEPMLRATIRRALAEQGPRARPFHEPRWFDRVVWQLQALFTSRSYEDVLFEKTHRFRVEEVFLHDLPTLGMISYASCDPARHSDARRVEATERHIARELETRGAPDLADFPLTAGLRVITRAGSRVALSAIVRGEPREFLHGDLAFAVRRIERQHATRGAAPGESMLATLQPYLEDCLLIQSPAPIA